MTLSEKLLKLIEQKGVTSYEVSIRSGVSESTLSRILNGHTGKMSLKTQDMLAKYFNVDISTFNESSEILHEAKIVTPSVINVPFISQYAYAGYLSGFQDINYMEVLPKIPFFVDEENPKGNYICVEVKGDSMNNGTEESIVEGDKLLCREVRREYWASKLHIKRWDFVIVHKSDGILVKRIINHDTQTGNITLHSLNDEYKDRVYNLDDIAQIFNIIEISRNRRR